MRFIGRTRELATLNRLADDDAFRMIVVYGRRRIGKTTLIQEFCRNRRALSFTATEVSDADNLRGFSSAIRRFFNEPEMWGAFPDWSAAFDYIAVKAQQDPSHPMVIVFDEFPYAAAAAPSLPSVLQVAIDQSFLQTNATMILCGSNEGFMESRVLGSKSPLYGRRDSQMHLAPLTLHEAVELMPTDASWEDQINYYAALGGTPYYLSRLSNDLSFTANLERLCFHIDGLLYEEPRMLLQQELRDPSMYFSILNAISAGRNTPKLIAENIGMPTTTLPTYLRTLSSLGLIERTVPFGDNPTKSKKGLWVFKDPFFAYWFRFVSPAIGWIEADQAAPIAQTATSGGAFATYVGQQYENMCMQWLLSEAGHGRLPFQPLRFGKWWGTDPLQHEQTDIDIVMDNQPERRLLMAECKWRNHLDESDAIDTLRDRRRLLPDNAACEYYLFTKTPASDGTKTTADQDPRLHLVCAQDILGQRA